MNLANRIGQLEQRSQPDTSTPLKFVLLSPLSESGCGEPQVALGAIGSEPYSISRKPDETANEFTARAEEIWA